MKRAGCVTFYAHLTLLALTLKSAVAHNSSIANLDIVLEESYIAENATDNKYPHRIVGGQPASIRLAPWQAALIREREFTCGGSVIGRMWILTAAHCVTGDLVDVLVRAGTRYFKRGGELRRAVLIVRHGNYNPISGANDIAMVRVNRPFTFSSSLRPVRLASANARLPLAFYVTGWGTISETGFLLTRGLHVATLALVRLSTCRRLYRGRTNVPARSLCAAAPGRDSCAGDSGGALVSGGVQYGIVAFGLGCARRNSPGVYMDVRDYRRWITRVGQTFANFSRM